MSRDIPFAQQMIDPTARPPDGPTEVLLVAAAKQLRGFKPTTALFPSCHRPNICERAHEIYPDTAQ